MFKPVSVYQTRFRLRQFNIYNKYSACYLYSRRSLEDEDINFWLEFHENSIAIETYIFTHQSILGWFLALVGKTNNTAILFWYNVLDSRLPRFQSSAKLLHYPEYVYMCACQVPSYSVMNSWFWHKVILGLFQSVISYHLPLPEPGVLVSVLVYKKATMK